MSNTPFSNEKRPRSRYYCKRCKRYLLSKICPIHGMEDTVAIDPSGANPSTSTRPTPANNSQASADDKFALPAAGQTLPNAPTPGPRKTDSLDDGPSDGDNQFLNKILEDIMIDEPVGNGTHKPPPAPEPEEFTPPKPEPAAEPPKTATQTKQNGEPVSLIDMIDDSFSSPPGKPAAQKIDIDLDPVVKVKEKPVEAPAPPRAAHTPGPAKKPKAAKAKAAPAAAKPKTKKSNGKRPPLWMYAAAVIPFLILFGVIYNSSFVGSDENADARGALYAQADVFYQNGESESALSAYQQFAEAYPNDDAIGTVTMRISELENRIAMSGTINSLLSKAEQAMTDGNHLTPREESALEYTNQVLQLDPTNAAAQNLQDQIGTYFVNQAEQAFDSENYDDAINHYKSALSVNPDDIELLREIDRSLQLKKVNELLTNLTEITRTKDELKQLQKEKYRLKNQVNQERRKYADLQRDPESTSTATSTATPKNTRPKTTQPVAQNNTKTTPVTSNPPANTPATSPRPNAEEVASLLGIELIDDSPADSGPMLIEEGMIDGGKKVYLHREKPSVPSNLQANELEMILAECIVGTDGKVESVNVLSGSENEQLNQIAVQSFEQYRYKPATYRGNPVRFKSIEMMSF